MLNNNSNLNVSQTNPMSLTKELEQYFSTLSSIQLLSEINRLHKLYEQKTQNEAQGAPDNAALQHEIAALKLQLKEEKLRAINLEKQIKDRLLKEQNVIKENYDKLKFEIYNKEQDFLNNQLLLEQELKLVKAELEHERELRQNDRVNSKRILETEKEQARQQILHLERQLANTQQEALETNKNLERQLSRVEQQVKLEQTAKINEKANANRQLEAEIKNNDQKLQQLKNQLEDSQKIRYQQEEEITALQAKLDNLQIEIDKQLELHNQTQQLLERKLRNAYAEIKQIHHSYKRQIDLLEQSLKEERDYKAK